MTGTTNTATLPAQPAQPPAPEPYGPEPTQTPEQASYVPSADPAAQQAAEGLRQAALTGVVRFYRVRANGSTRAVAYLPAGTEAREIAEYAAMMVGGGAAVCAVAQDMGVSVATVRRLVASVELADEVETDDDGLSDLYEDGVSAIYLSALDDAGLDGAE